MPKLINRTWLIIPDTREERLWKISYRNQYKKSLNENGLREYKLSIRDKSIQ